MPHHIIKFNGRYMDWSTVTDTPFSPFMTKAQFIAHWVMRNSPDCLCELNRKLALADRWGSSWPEDAEESNRCIPAEEVVSANKAGPGGCELTMGQLWWVYGLGEPYRLESGELWVPSDGPELSVPVMGLSNILRHLIEGDTDSVKETLELWLTSVSNGG